MEINVDNFWDEVWGAFILQLLKLQELLIQDTLVEEKGEEAVHVGPQEVRTEAKQPQRETRFGWLREWPDQLNWPVLTKRMIDQSLFWECQGTTKS